MSHQLADLFKDGTINVRTSEFMKTEIIDGYEVTVTDSNEFLTEIEEAALLLLDPSYFGRIPENQRLSSSAVVNLTNNLSSMSVWERPQAIKQPAGDIAKLASEFAESQIQSLIIKLAAYTKPMCLVRLRCGELYIGSILNHFSHLIVDPRYE